MKNNWCIQGGQKLEDWVKKQFPRPNINGGHEDKCYFLMGVYLDVWDFNLAPEGRRLISFEEFLQIINQSEVSDYQLFN